MEILNEWHITGLATGLVTFLIIGAFHPLVIKCHYRWGTQCWWWFLVLGIISAGLSVWVSDIFWSTVLGVLAFSSFWTIREVFEQEERVAKGWFPANPNRSAKPHK
jgi:hypothetical protein